jgi:hypothetical protein
MYQTLPQIKVIIKHQEGYNYLLQTAYKLVSNYQYLTLKYKNGRYNISKYV